MVNKPKDEPQTDMSVSDAMNVLAGFKNIWRATEKLDEALLVVSRAQGQKAELDAKNKDAEQKLAEKQASFDQAVAKLDAKEKEVADYTADLDAKKAAAKKQFDDDMAALGVKYSEMSVAMRKTTEDDAREMQAEIDALAAKKGDLQRDKRMIEAEIETLSKKKAELEAQMAPQTEGRGAL